MDSSDSEHRPKRTRRPRPKPVPLPKAPSGLLFACVLSGGPFDGLKLMMQLPLPDEFDLARYDGGDAGARHYYRRGACDQHRCTYTWERSEPIAMFQSGGAHGPATV